SLSLHQRMPCTRQIRQRSAPSMTVSAITPHMGQAPRSKFFLATSSRTIVTAPHRQVRQPSPPSCPAPAAREDARRARRRGTSAPLVCPDCAPAASNPVAVGAGGLSRKRPGNPRWRRVFCNVRCSALLAVVRPDRLKRQLLYRLS